MLNLVSDALATNMTGRWTKRAWLGPCLGHHHYHDDDADPICIKRSSLAAAIVVQSAPSPFFVSAVARNMAFACGNDDTDIIGFDHAEKRI